MPPVPPEVVNEVRVTVACVETAINAMGESNRSRSEADFCKYRAGLSAGEGARAVP